MSCRVALRLGSPAEKRAQARLEVASLPDPVLVVTPSFPVLSLPLWQMSPWVCDCRHVARLRCPGQGALLRVRAFQVPQCAISRPPKMRDLRRPHSGALPPPNSVTSSTGVGGAGARHVSLPVLIGVFLHCATGALHSRSENRSLSFFVLLRSEHGRNFFPLPGAQLSVSPVSCGG